MRFFCFRRGYTSVRPPVMFNDLIATIELLPEGQIGALSNAVAWLDGSVEEDCVFCLVEDKSRQLRANRCGTSSNASAEEREESLSDHE